MTSSPVSDNAVEVRPYENHDAADTLAVFLAAINETASADYTAQQIRAWADPDGRDLEPWNAAMLVRGSVVGTVGGRVVGFSDVSRDGYVDMMFVAPTFLRRGVASALLASCEQRAREGNVGELTADVSITARPFFERHGFAVVAEQSSVTRGVALRNYKMRKPLH
ncbi:GNAT family N-acetyltransferase [Nesterenkonia halotolerans]|uniref:GNAT family N-acetyltransferase n=1 Tax=Nesterenkonia halotolerans TaxID=225325 RepID=UPI003EE5539F